MEFLINFSNFTFLILLGLTCLESHWPTWVRDLLLLLLLLLLSLQSCPTLCDPIDGSLPGSPVPGILQARTLEWVALSFSDLWKWKVKGKSLSHVRSLATPWTAAYQAPPSMGFPRQEYWSGGSGRVRDLGKVNSQKGLWRSSTVCNAFLLLGSLDFLLLENIIERCVFRLQEWTPNQRKGIRLFCFP